MVYIKLLSGEVYSIEGPRKVCELKAMMDQPCCIFFLEDRVLEDFEELSSDSIVSILKQSYRLYFVWSGCNNSVWPGEFNQTYCFDYSLMEEIEWRPDIMQENDIVVVDYLSFGLHHPYNDMIKDVLGIDYCPIDLDRVQLDEILIDGRERAMTDGRKMPFSIFFMDYVGLEYMGYNMTKKFALLFRLGDGEEDIERTPLEWINRVTQR